LKEYSRILENLEGLNDIRLFDEVKAGNEKSLPLEEYRQYLLGVLTILI
jgi:hypothetical protein